MIHLAVSRPRQRLGVLLPAGLTPCEGMRCRPWRWRSQPSLPLWRGCPRWWPSTCHELSPQPPTPSPPSPCEPMQRGQPRTKSGRGAGAPDDRSRAHRRRPRSRRCRLLGPSRPLAPSRLKRSGQRDARRRPRPARLRRGLEATRLAVAPTMLARSRTPKRRRCRRDPPPQQQRLQSYPRPAQIRQRAHCVQPERPQLGKGRKASFRSLSDRRGRKARRGAQAATTACREGRATTPAQRAPRAGTRRQPLTGGPRAKPRRVHGAPSPRCRHRRRNPPPGRQSQWRRWIGSAAHHRSVPGLCPNSRPRGHRNHRQRRPPATKP
mmetsp:Transcript_40061/g.87371  ORF Transcript_40061/g.87371 Transcript_40061/m.87371 type:complete len:322 (-) Transcript_40061:49-1014(-)